MRGVKGGRGEQRGVWCEAPRQGGCLGAVGHGAPAARWREPGMPAAAPGVAPCHVAVLLRLPAGDHPPARGERDAGVPPSTPGGDQAWLGTRCRA